MKKFVRGLLFWIGTLGFVGLEALTGYGCVKALKEVSQLTGFEAVAVFLYALIYLVVFVLVGIFMVLALIAIAEWVYDAF